MRLIGILGLTALVTPAAYGYLDPGTGSMILQIALAGIFSSLFFIKNIWSYVKQGVAKVLGRTNANTPETEETTSNEQN